MKEQSLLPGVIKIAFDAKRVLDSRVSGMAVMSRGIPMAMDSIIWAASNGKMITALAAMMLVERGCLSLDDPAAKFLPHFKRLWVEEADGRIRAARNQVTIRHLLSHTSGLKWLPGFFQNRELSCISLETSTHVYAASPLLFEPGSASNYSNAGVNTVGRIIEVITGVAYEDFVRQHIFAPLEMDDTGYFLTAEQEARRAYGYACNEKGEWEERPRIEQLSITPLTASGRYAECGGGLFSTAADMLKLAQTLAAKDGRLVSEASLYEMARNQCSPGDPEKYGLCSTCEDDHVLGHGGALGTSLKVDLDSGCGSLLIVQRCSEWPQWVLDGEEKNVGMQSADQRI